MQRVLSFPSQSNRGFGDPGEFVTKRMCFSFMFSIGFLAILAGFLLGRFVFDQELELSRTKLRKIHQHHQQMLAAYKNHSQLNLTSFVDQISASNLEQHLHSLRKGAGSQQGLHEATLLRSFLKDNDFDLVSPIFQSQMNLSFPDPRRENEVAIEHAGHVEWSCNDSRTGMTEPDGDAHEMRATVAGSVVYVNFGRNEDYHLLDSLGVSVKGGIALARLGGVAPVDLVVNALEHEASGVVLYLDPQQKTVADPFLSPADLAKLHSLGGRRNAAEAVPVLFVTPGDAERIFREMSTVALSSEGWRGDLNSSYPIGPGFGVPEKRMLMIVNTLTVTKKCYDVVGAIRGTQEPDRFAILAHERKSTRDDLDSTAILMEIIRNFGSLGKAKGWRPQRSIVVASLGTENHFRRYSREYWSRLERKAAAYLRIESGPSGNDSALCRGTPILGNLFRDAAKLLSPDPPPLDVMLQMETDNAFVENGIPFLAVRTGHGAGRMKEAASFWSALTWKLAESHGLPFDLDGYVAFFNRSLEIIEQRFKMVAPRQSLFLDSFFEETQKLIAAMLAFQSKWSHADLSKSIEMRVMNDQLLRFVHALGCRNDRSTFSDTLRHAIFSRSTRGNDPRAGFGVLQDLLRDATSANAPEDLQNRIVTHLGRLVECVNEARFSLSDDLETFVLRKKRENEELYNLY